MNGNLTYTDLSGLLGYSRTIEKMDVYIDLLEKSLKEIFPTTKVVKKLEAINQTYYLALEIDHYKIIGCYHWYLCDVFFGLSVKVKSDDLLNKDLLNDMGWGHGNHEFYLYRPVTDFMLAGNFWKEHEEYQLFIEQISEELRFILEVNNMIENEEV